MNKKTLLLSLTIGTAILIQAPFIYAEKAPQEIYDLAKTTLATLGENPIILKAVKEQNAEKLSLDQIKEKDAKWKATPGIDDNMKTLLENDCAKFLKELTAENSFYAEIFVMDNQGANVAMSDKTSDYWQGDEAKFKKSYADGKGAIFVDEVEFDESTQAYLVQVSVPVKTEDVVIGAITFGIDLDALEQN